MTFPISKKVKVYSLRSSDQKADEGILPTEEEMKKFGMQMITLKNTNAKDMLLKIEKEIRK